LINYNILAKNNTTQIQIINSNIAEKRKNGRVRIVSSTAASPDTVLSDRSTPSSSYSDLPTISQASLDVPSPLSLTASNISARDEEEIDPPRSEKLNVDVVEKDTVVISKNTTYTTEGVEQGNTTQIRLEHTTTTTLSSENSHSTSQHDTNLEKLSMSSSMSSVSSMSKNMDGETNTTGSTSSFDASEENLVYYKEIKIRKKHPHIEKIPIQQKGKYYLVIENGDKGPITRHFNCHAKLSQGDILFKESFTNDAKKKLHDDFSVDTESADLTLEIAHTNSPFGKSELQISLYLKNNNEEAPNASPHHRTGEVVWAVSACEVEKKHPQKFTAKIPTSGKYYVVAEKVDKIYGGLREIAVDAVLTLPVREGETAKISKVVSVVVGGVKARPMKWKSPVFTAPAGSVIEFNVMSYAIVGSIIYSLRVRKVPGLTAEEERTRKMVLMFMGTFGVYYLFYMAMSLLHFIQNIGFTFTFMVLSIDITIGRICFILCGLWFRTNQELLAPFLRDVMETVGKILRKIKHFRDMSDGGKFDILRIFKKMSKEGKLNDLRKWERQKLQTANE